MGLAARVVGDLAHMTPSWLGPTTGRCIRRAVDGRDGVNLKLPCGDIDKLGKRKMETRGACSIENALNQNILFEHNCRETECIVIPMVMIGCILVTRLLQKFRTVLQSLLALYCDMLHPKC